MVVGENEECNEKRQAGVPSPVVLVVALPVIVIVVVVAAVIVLLLLCCCCCCCCHVVVGGGGGGCRFVMVMDAVFNQTMSRDMWQSDLWCGYLNIIYIQHLQNKYITQSCFLTSYLARDML